MAGKTKYVYLQGKCKWAKLTTIDKYGNWSIILYPDKNSMEIINELKAEGLKNVIGKDDDGYFVSIRRPQSKMIRSKVVGFAAPEVLEQDGKTPFRDYVGNGSDVTVKCEVYYYKDPYKNDCCAWRLMSVRVDTLVPYNIERDQTVDDEKLTRGIDQQPSQKQYGF